MKITNSKTAAAAHLSASFFSNHLREFVSELREKESEVVMGGKVIGFDEESGKWIYGKEEVGDWEGQGAPMGGQVGWEGQGAPMKRPMK